MYSLAHNPSGNHVDTHRPLRSPRIRLKLSQQDLSRVTAWTRDRIELNDRPVWKVAEELSRYNAVKFEFLDPKIASESLGGEIATTDVDAFLRDLQTLCIASYTAELSDTGVNRILLQAPSASDPLTVGCLH